jgi:signal transduction histidine kinase
LACLDAIEACFPPGEELVPHNQLGLFDTPPNRRQIQIGFGLTGLMFAMLAVLIVQPDVRMRRMDAFIPMVDAIILLGDLITATLLFVEAGVFRSRSLIVLASGYVITALLLVAHVLSFPGAFAPEGLLGPGINTTAWIAYFWRATLPITIILYVLLRRADSERPIRPGQLGASIAIGLSSAAVTATVVTLLTTFGHDLLPSVFLNRTELNAPTILKINLALIALLVAATAILFANRRSVLDMWLLVALATWLAHALLNLETWGRWTLGFYSQFVMLLSSHFLVMIALIAETNRLYARLAISTTARNRERESRLMSMDAVAAAISHEAGQPLTSVTLNASAALQSLNQKRPNVEKAIKALRASLDDARRTFDVLRSVRAMFAKSAGSSTHFNINELAGETALLLDREIVGHKVALKLDLDDAVPPIRANRVQIQRVLLNLLGNAIDSLGPRRRKPRHIAIRTARLDGQNVLLEVMDTGAGIAPAKLPYIFDAFFTTKANGTGLGLSLCRTIVEEHGGRIWASSDEGNGATFHVQLPSTG